jgi:hypothetical protein
MSVTLKGSVPPGILVSKAAQNLPQTATATLFTVTGGAVLVQFMYGLVTTALGSTATSLSLGNTPTGGANAPASIATLAVVTSKVIGSLYVPSFSAGVAAAPLQANVVGMNTPFVPFVVSAGVITWTTNASDTGQMSWNINYVPIDAGAAVS